MTFLDAIERWRYENQEEVCYVTFNYDTMLEESITSMWGVTFDSFNSYITQPYFKVIKLHGSIDWGLEFKTYPVSSSFGINEVIDGSTRELNLSNRYR